MSTTLDRPSSRGPARPAATGDTASPGGPARSAGHTPGSPAPDRTLAVEMSVLALVAAAALPLGEVFASSEWIRPTAGAVLVTLGVAAVGRRTRLRLSRALALECLALTLYLGVVFAPSTMVAGFIPTLDTPRMLWARLVEGLAIIPERVAPTAVLPPLALLAVAGAGAIALITDLLVHAGRAPLKAATVALTLWAVPLSMSPPSSLRWTVTVPMLVAIGALLLASSGTDLARWGRWIHPRGPDLASGSPFGPTGLVVGCVAIVAGVVLASTLPGYGQPPWWMVGGQGGSTLAANPIVQLRSNLVASGTEPIFTVTTPRPVYLRTTALDEYGEFEEWTTSGIRTRPLRDGIMARGMVESAFRVDVRVGDVSRAELVPMPFQPLRVSGGVSDAFQFDPRSGTVALDEGTVLGQGDTYSVRTAVPQPSAEQLQAAGERLPRDPMTALPDNVPPEVGELAAEIVDAAGATTPFEQALAIQNELRTWEYSTEPHAGHDGNAMVSFLDNRVGYCEQYAGTMAVMLRTLDIPARVAVGFTPGRLLTEGGDTYEVSWSNSHAWVEVRFDDLGWIAFEPTPRGDGNVLVPTSGDPSPADLQQDPTAANQAPVNPYANSQLPQPGDDILSADELPRQGVGSTQAPGTGRQGGSPWAVVAVVAAVVAALAGMFAWRRMVADPDDSAPPGERILAAGRRVARVGAGLRVPQRPSETDREYVRRLGVGVRFGAAGDDLAAALTRVRYAPSVDAGDAARAERAATAVIAELTNGLSRPRRAAVTLRGGALELLARIRDRVRVGRWWPTGAAEG